MLLVAMTTRGSSSKFYYSNFIRVAFSNFQFGTKSDVLFRYTRTTPSPGISINKSKAWQTFKRPDDPVNTLRIGDTRGFSEYVGGGTFVEKKMATPYAFKSLAASITHPGYVRWTYIRHHT